MFLEVIDGTEGDFLVAWRGRVLFWLVPRVNRVEWIFMEPGTLVVRGLSTNVIVR